MRFSIFKAAPLAALFVVTVLSVASCSSTPSGQIQGTDTQTAVTSPIPADSPTQVVVSSGGTASSVSPSPSVTSSAGSVTYVEDLQQAEDSDPDDGEGIAQVNGTSYQHSRAAQFCFGSNERKWVFVLERNYASFQGVIGLSDNSVATAKIRFDVLTDGQLVYSKDLQVGQVVTLNIPVKNVLQLGLDTTLLTSAGGCGAATGEWADLRVIT